MTQNALKLLLVFFLLLANIALSKNYSPTFPSLLDYIEKHWKILSRHALDVRAQGDEKIPGIKTHVLVSSKQSIHGFNGKALHEMPDHLNQPHVLYLPYSYIVPGGRFNEVYAWDTYFVVLGLLASNKLKEVKEALENSLYAIEHYGFIPTANRSYYLTRSQPPFITRSLRSYFKITHDKEFVKRALPLIERYYFYFFDQKNRIINKTGLSRYFDHGKGPAPEVLWGERDHEGRSHFERVKVYFRQKINKGVNYHRFYDRAKDRLTDYYYLADRAMRESGFDVSNRFGVFGSEVLEFIPVCLNTLLYVMETDISFFYAQLGEHIKSNEWTNKATLRKKKIDDLLWEPKGGLYLDYHYPTRSRRYYPFLTTFWPLWAKMASQNQARAVVKNLRKFEAPGGLAASTQITGNQWDSPFGFAPLQLITIEALNNYGYEKEAKRITKAFLSLIIKDYTRTGKIFEKYNVLSLTSDLGHDIKYGYPANEEGFAWTNGVFIYLYNSLPPEEKAKLMRNDGISYGIGP